MLSSNVVVEQGAKVVNSVIMANTVVKSGAVVSYSILDENVVVEKDATVGGEKPSSIAVLGRGVTVSRGATVKSGKIIDKDYKGE